MKIPKLSTRLFVTGGLVVVALLAAGFLYKTYVERPWTRSGQVRARLVLIAPRVTGWVTSVEVKDNQEVSKGDLLFQIDPRSFEIALEQARTKLAEARQGVLALDAGVEAAQASLQEAEASVVAAKKQIEASQASLTSFEKLVTIAEAGVHTSRAVIRQTEAQIQQHKIDRDRSKRLSEQGAASVQEAQRRAMTVTSTEARLDQNRAALESAEASLAKSRADLLQAQANRLIADTKLLQANARRASAQAAVAQAKARLGASGDDNVQVRAALAQVAQAELDLKWTRVKAPSDGYVTNVNITSGSFAAAGAPLMVFVDRASFYVFGFFKETQLRYIHDGDRAVVTLMSRKDQPLEGVVDSVGWAINPPKIAETGQGGQPGMVPQVQPTFDWIRLAQRVPVRIRLTKIPEGVTLIAGLTASVAIQGDD